MAAFAFALLPHPVWPWAPCSASPASSCCSPSSEHFLYSKFCGQLLLTHLCLPGSLHLHLHLGLLLFKFNFKGSNFGESSFRPVSAEVFSLLISLTLCCSSGPLCSWKVLLDLCEVSLQGFDLFLKIFWLLKNFVFTSMCLFSISLDLFHGLLKFL